MTGPTVDPLFYVLTSLFVFGVVVVEMTILPALGN